MTEKKIKAFDELTGLIGDINVEKTCPNCNKNKLTMRYEIYSNICILCDEEPAEVVNWSLAKNKTRYTKSMKDWDDGRKL